MLHFSKSEISTFTFVEVKLHAQKYSISIDVAEISPQKGRSLRRGGASEGAWLVYTFNNITISQHNIDKEIEESWKNDSSLA